MKKFLHKYLLSILFYGFIALIILGIFTFLFAHAYQSRGYMAIGGEWCFLFGAIYFWWVAHYTRKERRK